MAVDFGYEFAPKQGLTDDELADRQTYVGGSDIAAVLGLSKYGGPWSVWHSKVQGAVTEATDRMRLGTALEPGILAAYQAHTGRRVWRPGLRRLAEAEVCGTRVDALAGAYGEAVPTRCVEIKNVHYSQRDSWGREGTDEIPIDYLCQALWHCGIWGMAECDVVALIGGEPRYYVVKAKPEMFAEMVQKAVHFWDTHVVPAYAPPLDGSPAATEAVNRIKQTEAVTLAATEEADVLINRLHELKSKLGDLESQKDSIENQLKHMIGSAQGLRGSTYSVGWSQVAGRTKIDWQGICNQLGATSDDIEAATTISEPYRRFTVRSVR